MGAFFETIPESLIQWILDQNIFWVSTAPLAANGHVNVSPKGGKNFGVPDNKTFWYLDEPGNGRCTILLNAFDGPPRIMRLWGKGRVLENGSRAFQEMVEREKIDCLPGTRSVIVVDVHQVGTSCGFSVPYYDFREFRTTLNEFFERKEQKFLGGNEKESMDRYWALKNSWSMDGLPGMRRGLAAVEAHGIEPLKKMVGPLAPARNPGGGPNGEWTLRVEHWIIIFLTLIIINLVLTHPRYDLEEAKKQMSAAISSVVGSWTDAFVDIE
ncbi:hypothetical protein F4778DRAFT_773353 [Xylariomycetidae sp. FL2044]|nr:hypothetical protein F4778DRAFT_773353 [Xylariomycetidae sp. FL2044]